MLNRFMGMLGVLLVIYSQKVFACGSFTHMFIAEKSTAFMQNVEMRTLLNKYLGELKLGSLFPDVGYVSDQGFLKDLRIGSHTAVSQKEYGEVMHWDPFLLAFKRYLEKNYPSPTTEAPRLVAFLMGVATHRVSDDIWHNKEDLKPNSEVSTFPFTTCKKSASNFCYIGMISKIADIEAIAWGNKFEDAHSVADRGIEYAVLSDKGLTKDYAPTDWNFPFGSLTQVFQDPVVQSELGKPMVLTETDLQKDIATFKELTINGILAIKSSELALMQNQHRLDWVRDNYEKDPDVGLIAIEKQVAKFLDTFL